MKLKWIILKGVVVLVLFCVATALVITAGIATWKGLYLQAILLICWARVVEQGYHELKVGWEEKYEQSAAETVGKEAIKREWKKKIDDAIGATKKQEGVVVAGVAKYLLLPRAVIHEGTRYGLQLGREQDRLFVAYSCQEAGGTAVFSLVMYFFTDDFGFSRGCDTLRATLSEVGAQII